MHALRHCEFLPIQEGWDGRAHLFCLILTGCSVSTILWMVSKQSCFFWGGGRNLFYPMFKQPGLDFLL